MPIDTGDKIYIHMPKTGGSWMSRYLTAFHEGQMIGGHGHQSARTLQRMHIEGKILWGTIRDPWSWYLSWYAHGMKARHYQERYAKYGNGSTEFKDVLMGLLARDPNRCPKKFTAIWSLPHEEKRRSEYLEGDIGFYTWTFFHMFGDRVKTFIDTKKMYEGLEELFGVEVARETSPPANEMTFKLPKAKREMYDDEMIEAVYENDRFLISLLGYEGPFTSLSQTLLRL